MTEALPRGRHALPRKFVVENQRSRLLAGAAQAIAEHGYAGLAVEQIISAAGVSRTTFYDNFENKRDCVLVAHEETFDRLAGTIFRACASEREWPRRLAAAVRAAIEFSVESPVEARLLVLDTVGADPQLAARVLASNEHLIGLLRAGRQESAKAALLPELVERALVGAASSVIGARLMQDQIDDLARIEPELVQLMLIPYVSVDEAQQLAAVAA
jgi:TetR/AcrR family transcriptional regulator